MDLFDKNDEIAELEFQLPHLSASSYIDTLVQLAWKWRQRDSAKALAYAQEAQKLLDESGLVSALHQRCQARLTLVHAEIQWLSMELIEAVSLAHASLERFCSIEDWRGAADVHWLLAWISVDDGKLEQRDEEFSQMAQAATKAQDDVRVDIANAALARWQALNNPQLAAERWKAHFQIAVNDDNPARVMWSCDFLSTLLYFTGEVGQSLSYSIQAHTKALETGQIYFAIIAAVNIADELLHINENLAALDWVQRALDLAKKTNWIRSKAMCLMEMSQALRRINNYPAAQEMISEALAMLAPISGSRSYALALSYQGELALNREDYPVALQAFYQLEQRANALKQIDFQIDSLRGQAKALSCTNRAEEALAVAEASLNFTREHGEMFRQIEIVMLIAEIYIQHPGLNSKKDEPSNIVLAYLSMALDMATKIQGYVIPSKLYVLLSDEYAKEGKFSDAYAMAKQAIGTKEKIQSLETVTRANTMQAFYQIERAREEGENHRQVALLESRRSSELLQITSTLEQLSAIGCEITTHLDQEDIFNVLNQYVHTLLDVNTFKIYLIEKNQTQLLMIFCIENGVKYQQVSIDINDPVANSARCYRERVEVLCDFTADNHASLITDTLQTVSGLFFPLFIGERKIGVMSVESIKPNAFGQREFLIFRNLCAFAAIGLDNAQTYQQLQTTQKQLVYNEKMAALGSLVAGVAHELNTPIGNGLLLASSLNDKSNELAQKMQDSTLRRSELINFIEECQRGAYLIFRSIQTAADLVMSFKQVSVDQTTAQRRRFNIKQLISDIVATMNNQFIHRGIAIQLDIPDQVMMDSYPGPLGQVIMNIMQNALFHAFEGRTSGNLSISSSLMANDMLDIRITDDGIGIAHENLDKIFDPFFTTKLGSGGNGLGLSISYNIIKSILDGDVFVESKKEDGSTFILQLPLVASLKQE